MEKEKMRKKARRIKEHFGFLIRSARTDRKMTQKALSKVSGVTQESITRAETKGCDISLAIRLLHPMGFTLDENAIRSIDPFAKGLTFIN